MAKKRSIPMISAVIVTLTIVLLFIFSGQSGPDSNALSRQVMNWIVSVLELELSSVQLKVFHSFIRKSAHVGLFFILGVGLMAFLRRFGLKRALCGSVLLSIGIAAANEYHQFLGGTRTASVDDVILDSISAVAGCLIYCIIYGVVVLSRRMRSGGHR